jgi:hypothetical protein
MFGTSLNGPFFSSAIFTAGLDVKENKVWRQSAIHFKRDEKKQALGKQCLSGCGVSRIILPLGYIAKIGNDITGWEGQAEHGSPGFWWEGRQPVENNCLDEIVIANHFGGAAG